MIKLKFFQIENVKEPIGEAIGSSLYFQLSYLNLINHVYQIIPHDKRNSLTPTGHQRIQPSMAKVQAKSP